VPSAWQSVPGRIIAVKNLFDRFGERAGVGRSGIDFFEVPGVTAADDRRDTIVLRSLSRALTLLAGPAFEAAFNGSTNQNDYRWGRLHRVVFAHPIGGSFNTPPAGGAFPQPLPNLPGVSIDGGLYTVDVGNHPFDRDESNGFMVTFGVSRRYVASMTPEGVESFSIIPGGASGVPGDAFSVNLLPLWLTNESVPLIHDIDSLPAQTVSVETFRPSPRRGHKTGR
jgi:penicillin amidase